MMHLFKTVKLNRKQERAAAGIVAASNSFDGTNYGFPDAADRYCLVTAYRGGPLIAFAAFYRMGEKKDGREVYEAAVFTLPEYRRQAAFSRIMSVMGQMLAGRYLRYCVYDNPGALAVLEQRTALHDHDELMLYREASKPNMTSEILETDMHRGLKQQAESGMQKECNEKAECDAEKEAAAQGKCAAAHDAKDKAADAISIDHEEGRAYSEHSECWFRLSEDKSAAYIFGVQSYAGARRKGYAKRLLTVLFDELSERGVKKLMLQVSSDNVPALKLYEGLGMEESERLRLYFELFDNK